MARVPAKLKRHLPASFLGPSAGVYPLPAGVGSRHTRVALFSHDTQGLGHVRRNSLVAGAIVADQPDTDVLLIAGAPEVAALPLPPRTEVVTIPTLHKASTGAYSARVLSTSLDDVLAMREAVVDAALSTFAPDLLIVDKVARGVGGELDRPLSHVRAQHGTSTVLGLRDVLDGVDQTRREWALTRTDEAIADLYDDVWVYGDPAIFDPAVAYGWPAATSSKVRYTGYLARGRSAVVGLSRANGAPTAEDVDSPFVLCLVGGGQDGAALARAFAGASFPRGHVGVLITGPYMDRGVLGELVASASRRPDLVVLEFVADVPAFVERAAATVSMAGYNSVCELLPVGRPALLLPRTVPRVEQALRAEQLRKAGLVDVLRADPDPSNIGGWLSTALTRPRRAHAAVDLDGLARLPRLAAELIAEAPGTARTEAGHAGSV